MSVQISMLAGGNFPAPGLEPGSCAALPSCHQHHDTSTVVDESADAIPLSISREIAVCYSPIHMQPITCNLTGSTLTPRVANRAQAQAGE